MTQQPDEQKLREDMCKVLDMMYRRKFIGGPAGNISVRLDEDRFMMSPSTHFKHLLKPEQMIIIDSTGKKIEETEANRGFGPTSEVPMHLAAFLSRPDVGGVVHGHPNNCVALSAAGKEIRSQVLTEAMLFLGKIKQIPFATPTTQELGDTVAEYIVDYDSLVLPYHGTLTVGRTIWDAYALMELLEQVAEINCLVHSCGGEVPIGNERIVLMIELRKKYGMQKPSDSEMLD